VSFSSLSTLRTRLARLEAEAVKREQRSAAFTQTTNTTPLPSVEDWAAFASRTWIRTSGTVAPFIPYDFQIDLINSIDRYPNTIVNKSRQMGVSETVASYLACRAATEPGFAGVVFSKTQQDASDLGRRVRAMLNSIQGHSFRYTTDSNTLVSLVGGGTLYFLPGSPRAARGIPSGSVLWLDEAAFIDGADEIYRGAMPILSMVGEAAKVIITSTPDLELDFFGGLWHQGIPVDWYDYVRRHDIDGLNTLLDAIGDDWNRVAIHYSQHPVYSRDPLWADKTRESRRMTKSAWRSEYELAFGSTDSQVYPSNLISRAARGAWLECGHIGRDYVIGIDPNAGGDDYFVAIVLDITQKPYSVVSMYRANGKSTQYSLRKIKTLIDDYLPARIVIEKQSMGAVIGEALQQVLPEYQVEYFNTTRPSKITATDRILFNLEHDDLIFPECVICDELRAFQQRDTGERKAAAGHHDDTVMALALACSLIPEIPTTAAFFANL
jgi:hypothetical protein